VNIQLVNYYSITSTTALYYITALINSGLWTEV